MYLKRPGGLEGGDCFNIPWKFVGNIEEEEEDEVGVEVVDGVSLLLLLLLFLEEDGRFGFPYFLATLRKIKCKYE